jgi:tRNA (mo5U34)-methyltransferase
MTDRALKRRIDDLGPWFHNMRLNGIETAEDHPLGDYPTFKWRRFAHVLPRELGGMSVLDVGCNAGFYAIEMARRGASEVVAIDTDPRYLSQARLAADVLAVSIEFRRMSVFEVARLGRRFDLVIFMGVLYHLRHPLLALDLLWEHAVGDRLLFQSMQRGLEQPVEPQRDYAFEDETPFAQPAWPRLSFIEHCYAGDPTNWFVPNRAATEAMLRSSGFRITAHPEPEVYLCARGARPEWVEKAPV